MCFIVNVELWLNHGPVVLLCMDCTESWYFSITFSFNVNPTLSYETLTT